MVGNWSPFEMTRIPSEPSRRFPEPDLRFPRDSLSANMRSCTTGEKAALPKLRTTRVDEPTLTGANHITALRWLYSLVEKTFGRDERMKSKRAIFALSSTSQPEVHPRPDIDEQLVE